MSIVRIQSGDLTIAASATTPASAAALPVAVPAAQSLIWFQVRSAGGAQPQYDQVRHVLTIDGSNNITHISAARNAANAVALNCRYQISTHGAADLTVQHATVTLPGTTPPYDQTITAVTLARAFAMLSQSNNGTSFGNDDLSAITLPATTTARVNNAAPSSGATLAYQVADCGSAFASVQTFSVALASGDSSGTATISSVTIGASVPIIAMTSDTGTVANIGQKLTTAELTSTTQVTVTRGATGQAMTVYGFVVSFLDGTTVQHGETTIASGTSSGTASFSAVDQSRSVLLLRGWQNAYGRTAYASDDNPLVAGATLAFTADTDASITRSNTAAQSVFPWSVIQFAAHAPPPALFVPVQRGMAAIMTR